MSPEEREQIRLVTNGLVRMAGQALDIVTTLRRLADLPAMGVSEEEGGDEGGDDGS